MKQLVAVGFLLASLGCNSKHDDHGGHQGGQEHRHSSLKSVELMVATEPTAPVAGRPVTLKLMIHGADGRMVTDFETVHDEKIHLIIVRDALDQFAHIHPAVDAKGNLTVTHTFPVGGKYRLFADYKPAGGSHATAIASLSVGGESPPAPALIANAPGEVAASDVRTTISAAPLKVGKPARIGFALRDAENKPIRLEPYMGALGHLMFVSASGQYVHVHPAGGNADGGVVEFEAHFPQPGLYKGWGQFKQKGKVLVVPFVLNVE